MPFFKQTGSAPPISPPVCPMASLPKQPTTNTQHPTTDNRQPTTDNPPPLRFGLIGCGRVAPTHFDAIRALGERARLIAVCDTDPGALSAAVEQTGAEGYATLEDMLDRADIDIVSVCTPSGLHAEHGIAAARAGRHVVVEKPLDVTLEKARALIDTCAANRVRLYPILQNRLNPTVRLLKAAIDHGRFGEIYAINATMIWKRTQEYYDADAWRGTRAMDGGAFMNQGIHFVDLLRHLGGEILEVKSTLATLARDIECEDIGSALFRFKRGALGNLFVTTLGRGHQEGSLTVLGEHGQVKLGGACLNTIDLWDFDTPDPGMDAKARDADYITQSVYGFGHRAFYERIASNVGTDPANVHGGRDGMGSLALLLEITG